MLDTQENKRLIHGTLLLFSRDSFKSLICARVRANDELKEGYLYVDCDNVIHFGIAYTMIECVLFFEPYYHVLKYLQLFSHDSIPMGRYLVEVNTNVSYPKYLVNIRSYKLRDGLNTSQKTALHAAMNKEFVIIQGPPGTGKTFLGMELVKMLLRLKDQWTHRGPILIITYTNHALDQFLHGLRDFSNKIIRFGRNSKDIKSLADTSGPEEQLKMILAKLPNTYFYDRFFNNDDDVEDYDEPIDGFADIRDIIRQLVVYLNSDGSIHEPFYSVIVVNRKRYYSGISLNRPRRLPFKIDLNQIPIDLRQWLRNKVSLWNSSGNIMDYESSLLHVNKTLSDIIDYEAKAVISPQKLFMGMPDEMSQEVIPYCFENFEFFLWLLYDDGSILTNKKKSVKDTASEEEDLFYFLSNFVFACQSPEQQSYICLSEVIRITEDLEKIIRNQKNRRNVQTLTHQLHYIKQKIQYIEFCLKTDFGRPEENLSEMTNPFSLPSKTRWQLYKYWVGRCKILRRQKLDKALEGYLELLENHTVLKNRDTAQLCNKMDIIAMTASGAAKNRHILELMESPILVVEEAAEVLESHIITALTEHCQHLILLGDHQQLRPATSDHLLQRKYKLGVSLFERMIINGVGCHTLNVQHRMRPEISSLIHPLFYKTLINHPAVTDYPKVAGITYPLYFIDHIEPEEPYGDSSKMNIHESKFIIQLAVYLLKNNNYNPDRITILSAYRGQMYALKKQQSACASEKVKDIRIAVVDDFQGEENDIILLSLVRSNPEDKIGFLSTENRVCVALSRARQGFYIMGNMTQLCASSDVWKSIRTTLQSQNVISKFLPLQCKNHKEHQTLVSKETDFLKVPEGGCGNPCHALLNCGHHCVKMCHPYDVDHNLYQCKENCTMVLCTNVTHKCKKLCFKTCGPCNYAVSRQLSCGHNKKLPCHVDVENYQCLESQEIRPECGHVQSIPCHQDITDFRCEIEVQTTIPTCGHVQNMTCDEHLHMTDFKCKFETEVTLTCGHKRIMLCGDDKIQIMAKKCEQPCERPLKQCNDPENHEKCNLPCWESCLICEKFVIQTYDNCHHFKKLMCFAAESSKICEMPCRKKLQCGHKCRFRCSEPCLQRCTQTVLKLIPECGHKKKVTCARSPRKQDCIQRCSKNMQCGHKCDKLCNQPCSEICDKQCLKFLDCGHKCIQRCNEKCACQMAVFEGCGHIIAAKCNEDISKEVCEKLCIKRLPCGHQTKVAIPCSSDPVLQICNEQCGEPLTCGHTCSLRCDSKCSHLQKCQNKCLKHLPCGHPCQNLCEQSCTDECLLPCNKRLKCGHKCNNVCSEPCDIHVKCDSKCDKVLTCGHPCINTYQKPCACNILPSTDCEHFVRVACEQQPTRKNCQQECGKQLDCGHFCQQKCHEDCLCFESCRKRLKCGCLCIVKYCSDPCECRNRCSLNAKEEDHINV